jgi:hypothetical protein
MDVMDSDNPIHSQLTLKFIQQSSSSNKLPILQNITHENEQEMIIKIAAEKLAHIIRFFMANRAS